MRVLFAAFRRDPRDPAATSGAEFQFYRALERRGADVRLAPPPPRHLLLAEKLARRIYHRFTGRGYLKYTFSMCRQASRALRKAARAEQPDVVLTLFPAALVASPGDVPCVYRLDASFQLAAEDGPEFLHAGKWALRTSQWQERRAFRHSTRVITHSERSRDDLIDHYGFASDRIEVFPNPSALSFEALPAPGAGPAFDSPIELLLVGREEARKGFDIAIEVVEALNGEGTPARLTICGADGENRGPVRFAGFFDKSDPQALASYKDLYRRAHFLLHPARFDPSPMVTSEAAAFGLPVVTHANGGLATAVKDGESGIVLSRHSPANEYVRAIQELVRDPERYQAMRQTTHERYARELNWDVASRRLVAALERAVATRRKGTGS